MHGWDGVGVSHGSGEWAGERLLVDIPPIKKAERVVFVVQEKPHIRVDFPMCGSRLINPQLHGLA